jgi:hypothetical protein
MQNIIQIYPCLLKLSRKQESVTDRQTDRRTDAAITISPHRYHGGGDNYEEGHREGIEAHNSEGSVLCIFISLQQGYCITMVIYKQCTTAIKILHILI